MGTKEGFAAANDNDDDDNGEEGEEEGGGATDTATRASGPRTEPSSALNALSLAASATLPPRVMAPPPLPLRTPMDGAPDASFASPMLPKSQVELLARAANTGVVDCLLIHGVLDDAALRRNSPEPAGLLLLLLLLMLLSADDMKLSNGDAAVPAMGVPPFETFPSSTLSPRAGSRIE